MLAHICASKAPNDQTLPSGSLSGPLRSLLPRIACCRFPAWRTLPVSRVGPAPAGRGRRAAGGCACTLRPPPPWQLFDQLLDHLSDTHFTSVRPLHGFPTRPARRWAGRSHGSAPATAPAAACSDPPPPFPCTPRLGRPARKDAAGPSRPARVAPVSLLQGASTISCALESLESPLGSG